MARLLLCLVLMLPLLGCSNRSGPRPVKVAFMPKLIGIPYFNACKRGAEEAAKELNLELIYNGPTETDVTKQIGMIDQWTASGDIDCICVACNDPDQIARSLQKARNKKIAVITYDADTKAEARDFFVNMATYDSLARLMVDSMAEQLTPRGSGKVGILTSSVQAPNQSEWAKRMKAYVAEKYPHMTLLQESEHGENRDLGITKARALIQANPDLKGIIGLTSVAVPAAAEAVRQEKQQRDLDIKIGGVSTPRDMRDYIKDGTVREFILWNPVDLGYLAVYVADLKRQGKMPDNGTIKAGRLGEIQVKDREVLLGEPIRFNKDNVDKYDF
ncbi:MAG TPA: substrate-binding domain-containing protein [Gemmataceae bacterium]|nr:substrate-binding domain-containing protein [Gemmataceae bacterium]